MFKIIHVLLLMAAGLPLAIPSCSGEDPAIQEAERQKALAERVSKALTIGDCKDLARGDYYLALSQHDMANRVHVPDKLEDPITRQNKQMRNSMKASMEASFAGSNTWHECLSFLRTANKITEQQFQDVLGEKPPFP